MIIDAGVRQKVQPPVKYILREANYIEESNGCYSRDKFVNSRKFLFVNFHKCLC